MKIVFRHEDQDVSTQIINLTPNENAFEKMKQLILSEFPSDKLEYAYYDEEKDEEGIIPLKDVTEEMVDKSNASGSFDVGIVMNDEDEFNELKTDGCRIVTFDIEMEVFDWRIVK